MNYINKNLGNFFNVLKEEKSIVIHIPYLNKEILNQFSINKDYIKFNGEEYLYITNLNNNFYIINYLISNLNINNKISYFKQLYLIIIQLIKLNIEEVYLVNKDYINTHLIKYNEYVYVNKNNTYRIYFSNNQFLLPSKIKVLNDDYISLSFMSIFKYLQTNGLLYNIEEKNKLINKTIWNDTLNDFDPMKSDFYYPNNKQYEDIYVNYIFVDIGDLILENNNDFFKITESQLINNYLIENGKYIDGNFLLNQKIINNIT